MSEFVEIPANNLSLSMRKPLYGIGINDAEYITKPVINGKQAYCPYYEVWNSMITRCYSTKYQDRHPTYIGCSVSDNWLIFSNFKKWMISQDWRNKQLDKDILYPGNKQYDKDSCIFVTSGINSLLTNSSSSRGKYPPGVRFHKLSGKYIARCSNGKNRVDLGFFPEVYEAEVAYLRFKSLTIEKIACHEEASTNKRLQLALLRHAKIFKEKAIKLIHDHANKIKGAE